MIPTGADVPERHRHDTSRDRTGERERQVKCGLRSFHDKRWYIQTPGTLREQGVALYRYTHTTFSTPSQITKGDGDPAKRSGRRRLTNAFVDIPRAPTTGDYLIFAAQSTRINRALFKAQYSAVIRSGLPPRMRSARFHDYMANGGVNMSTPGAEYDRGHQYPDRLCVSFVPPALTHLSLFIFSGNGDRVVCAMATGDLQRCLVTLRSCSWSKYTIRLETVHSITLLRNGHLVLKAGVRTRPCRTVPALIKKIIPRSFV